ncbi:glutamate--cysteine ligase family protein [Actinokineospora spheciospongiae]|uniref:glutamate--cysteine ligase n=1 Tax=Actinokineospora spheciospongiae TaxID=909613 RepID=UPI000D7170F1|nr:glutamate--cysteine ligase [Actinokineospora spheciospongiae]PWW62798.1 hypothetical protein DFQ13_105616 [Actinokineospora spheciospongiae]
MGVRIDTEAFTDRDREVFRRRLEDSLVVLDTVLRRPGFGGPPDTVGAELEVFLVTEDGTPAPVNLEVIAAAGDHRLTHEVGRYNLELNLTPGRVAGRPFTALRAEVGAVLRLVADAGGRFGALPLTTGMLPTLRPGDFGRDMITDVPRYRVLDRELRRRRDAPLRIGISGADECVIEADSIAVQAACCSWQVHLTAAPDRLAITHDAVQLATAPLLAVSGNSPLLLGRRLWSETRIALYEQGMGDHATAAATGTLPRVTFGSGWTDAATGVFADVVRNHDVLVPEVSDEDPLTALRRGRVPGLDELRLHQSTVWRWNRPVYDPAGNVRVEARALPSGPTPVDMAANAAFLVGLSRHLATTGSGFTAAVPFDAAKDNFHRAAAIGPRALLRWPFPGGLRVLPAADLVRALLPAAADGLRDLGVDRAEVDRYLSVLEHRAATGRTGARWQRGAFEALRRRSSTERALRESVHRYRELSTTDEPVHTWPAPSRGAPW